MNQDLEAIDGLCEKIVEQRDRIAALEAALQSIVQWSDTYPVGHLTDYAGKIARAALDKDAGND